MYSTLRPGGTLNSCRAASPLMRLLEGEDGVTLPGTRISMYCTYTAQCQPPAMLRQLQYAVRHFPPQAETIKQHSGFPEG
ncbi:hypothetical protein TNCV_2008821 [Trichonephila clavipes]|nr:hypothetical protein TNCV_2008821 [Trichonephila clavipes]